MEIWKKVQGFNDKYFISNYGNVKSLCNKNEKILKPTIHKQNGYNYIQLTDSVNKKTIRLHKLVYETFNGKYNGIINHIDRNKNNNCLSNLEVVNFRENTCHYLGKKYNGVVFSKQHNKFRARIFFNKKSIHLGYFNDENEAFQSILKFELENNIKNKYR